MLAWIIIIGIMIVPVLCFVLNVLLYVWGIKKISNSEMDESSKNFLIWALINK